MNEILTVGGEKLNIQFRGVQDATKKVVLFIHGAGMASMDRYKYLTDFLSGLNFQSVLFNFSGHGSSSGILEQSSLFKRVKEATAVIEKYIQPHRFSIMASSMGGYVACKLLERYSVDNLILFCPAAYSKAAYQLPFNGPFSEEIRRKESWMESDSFQILQSFPGRFLLFIGDEDEIIPKGLAERLYDSAKNARSRKIVTIPSAPHALHAWLTKAENESTLESIKEMITNTIISKHGDSI